MQVDETLVDNLSNLARLSFSAAEKQEMMQDLARMIGFVEQLKEVDTTGVEPARFMGQSADVYRREDAAGDMFTTKQALQSATVHSEQYFLVPKVIKRN